MDGSILPGWARESGVYRPRRCSREQTCPVTNTEPCRAGAMAGPRPGLGTVAAVTGGVSRTDSGIAASRAALEGEELVVRRLVPALDQGRRRGALGVGHRPRFVLRKRYQRHEELLLPGQAGGAGGGDDRGPVADPSVGRT